MSELFVTLNIVDVALTKTIIDNGGFELNPIMKYLFETDLYLFIGIKILLAGLIIYLLRKKQEMLKGLCIGMGAIVLFNSVGVLV